ncbi:Neuropilin-1 [Exaiptasia diaphana]|nr:Neuropilin-1 [Exaiptasia diaphana]
MPCGTGGDGCILSDNRKAFQCKCKNAFEGDRCEKCKSPVALGLESRTIPNSQMTSSSIYSSKFQPYNARLNFVPPSDNSIDGGWAPKANRVGEWIQVDLGTVTMVAAVATQA